MQRTIMIVAGLISVAAGMWKIRAVRRRPNAPSVRALCVGLLAFGSAFLILAPPHTVILSEFLRVPNSGRLLGNLLTLGSAGAMQVMMLHLVHPPEVARGRVKRRLIVLVGIAVAMTVLMLSANTENETNFVERYSTYTPITVYQLLYLSFLAVAVVDLIHLSGRYSRHVDPMLKIGLRMVAAGGVLYAVHTGYKMTLIIGAWVHWPVPGDESAISTSLAAVGGVLIAGGTTLPVWGPRALTPWRWQRQYRSYRRLGPLWRRLTTAVPDVILASPDGLNSPARPWDIGTQLYRRVIEIRDAQMLLTPFADQQTVSQAADDARNRGLTGDRAKAYVDATALAIALINGRNAGSNDVSVDTPRAAGDVTVASLSRETQYLEHVAAALSSVLPSAGSINQGPRRRTTAGLE
jgi:hypothetical protein